MTALLARAERHQVPVYLVAVAAAAAAGLALPSARHLDAAVEPVLGLLLWATFLQVPLDALGGSLRDGRFLAALLGLNFLVVPVLAWALSRVVAGEPALLLGVLLVLLTPCVDYVVVFSGLAGGAADRLLAASPLLVLLQLLLLPPYLLLFAGPRAVAVVEVAPFVRALLLLVLLPLAAAAVTRALARRHRGAERVRSAGLALVVPLVVAVLVVVVASRAGDVAARASELVALVPVYAAFLVLAALAGIAVGRLARLDVAAHRALVFSGATRNSLVVLPLALALPAELSLATAAVVTQTLVELLGMALGVRVVPLLVPAAGAGGPRR